MELHLLGDIRRKLTASFLMVALILLLLLAFINKHTAEKALTDNARQTLFAVANETANRINDFIGENLDAVRVEAISPGLAGYLGLTFAQPLVVALALLEKQVHDAMLPFAIIALIVIIVAFSTAQLLTKSIIYLTDIVFRFTTGNLYIRPKINSKDEIDQLAKSFNNMALQLQTSFETLEQRVLERTAELVIAKEKAEDANQKLEQLVNLDGLTQVANRRCFNGRLQAEWKRLAREQQPLSLILFDVDQFKLYNDYYGHPGGDDCLTRIAQAVQRTVRRPADLVARYGGEEFSVLLPNTDLAGSIQVAQNIQQAIHDLVIPHAKSDVRDIVTVSMGITSRVPTLDIKPDILITLADKALYNAKKNGRDRYCYHLCEV